MQFRKIIKMLHNQLWSNWLSNGARLICTILESNLYFLNESMNVVYKTD